MKHYPSPDQSVGLGGERHDLPSRGLFEARLGSVLDSSVGRLSDFAGALAHEGKTGFDQSAIDNLHGLELSGVVLETFTGQGSWPNKFSLRRPEHLDQLTELGRVDSQHGTFSVAMDVESRADEATGVAISSSFGLAVKPFVLRAATSMARECAMLQYLEGMGLPVPKLLGVLVDRETGRGAMYMMTQFRPDMISLDSHNWSGLLPDQVTKRIRPAVDTLAMLHSVLVFHGDPEFKNIATSEEAGSVVIFDLEFAVSHAETVKNLAGDDVPESIVRSLGRDLYHIQKSFEEFIYPNLPEDIRPQADGDKLQYETDHFIEPYRAALREGGSPHVELLERALNIIVAQRRAGIAHAYEDVELAETQ